jgi:anti-sigma factor RsiW
MPSCREVEPLVTPYVDGEATAAERGVVEAHLMRCPPCRQRTAAETVAREAVRTHACRPCAPEHLRARCRAAAQVSRFGIPRSLLAAAALVFLAGGVLLYGRISLSPAVLAAQLTLDHVTCFAVHESGVAADPQASEQQYAREYGEQIELPSGTGLQLVGLRRCYCGEGAAAHAMYRLDGRPVSLYIIPDAGRSRASTDVFGHDAVIWSSRMKTYVLVAREPRDVLEKLAEQIEGGL